MGKIEEIRTTEENKIEIDIALTKKELMWLRGTLNDMHLFSEENLSYESRLIKRGRQESTKYFLLPKTLRDGVNPSNHVNCNRIETKTNDIFIFSVPKQ